MGRIIPYIMENKKCSKPPTRYIWLYMYIYMQTCAWEHDMTAPGSMGSSNSPGSGASLRAPVSTNFIMDSLQQLIYMYTLYVAIIFDKKICIYIYIILYYIILYCIILYYIILYYIISLYINIYQSNIKQQITHPKLTHSTGLSEKRRLTIK